MIKERHNNNALRESSSFYNDVTFGNTLQAYNDVKVTNKKQVFEQIFRKLKMRTFLISIILK